MARDRPILLVASLLNAAVHPLPFLPILSYCGKKKELLWRMVVVVVVVVVVAMVCLISYDPHHHQTYTRGRITNVFTAVQMMVDLVSAFPLPSCSVRIWYESATLGYPTSKDSFLKKITPRECRERELTYGLIPNPIPIPNPNPKYGLISTHNNDVLSANDHHLTFDQYEINISYISGTVPHFKLRYAYRSMKENQFSFTAGWEIVQ